MTVDAASEAIMRTNRGGRGDAALQWRRPGLLATGEHHREYGMLHYSMGGKYGVVRTLVGVPRGLHYGAAFVASGALPALGLGGALQQWTWIGSIGCGRVAPCTRMWQTECKTPNGRSHSGLLRTSFTKK